MRDSEAGEGYALLLAARALIVGGIGLGPQAQGTDHGARPAVQKVPGHAADLKSQRTSRIRGTLS